MKKFLIIGFLLIAIHTNTLYAQDFLTSQLMQYFTYASTLNEDNLPHTNQSFSKAKKLMKKVYYDNQYSFYCGCRYDYRQIKGTEKTVVDASSCGYIPRKNEQRGQFIEWEHVVPAWAFGNTRQCWREPICTDKKGKSFKGRKCCEKVDPVFRAMQADMYNLQPAVGELNADRSNYHYGIIPGEPREYGACDFEVEGKLAEPKEDIRGDIARTYFYMEYTYGVRISDKQRKLFQVWDRQDPVSEWERIRAGRIEAIQGNKNKFITK